ncbi:MAG: dihydrofolate reductase [Panacagrimonas sp.]
MNADQLGQDDCAELWLIAAMDRRGLIGRDGDLPWRLPNDLRHFKQLTLGKIVLMGRRTWDSLGRPLPGRENWVLSRDNGLLAPGARVFPDLVPALKEAADKTVMVIGGAELYRQCLPMAKGLLLTEVHAELDGDVFFPPFDRQGFRELAREVHPADEKHAYAYDFVRLARR